MKKSIIASVIVLAGIVAANAGNNIGSGYSSANYKHPNKAQKAKELNLDNSKSFDHVSKEAVAFDNYKNNFANSEENGGILPVLPVENGFGLASSANYKNQFRKAAAEPSAPAVEKAEPVAVR